MCYNNGSCRNLLAELAYSKEAIATSTSRSKDRRDNSGHNMIALCPKYYWWFIQDSPFAVNYCVSIVRTYGCCERNLYFMNTSKPLTVMTSLTNIVPKTFRGFSLCWHQAPKNIWTGEMGNFARCLSEKWVCFFSIEMPKKLGGMSQKWLLV